MEKIEYKLEIFEGPLDLLLHLIEKNKLDIFDINISQILEQYLDYIYIMERADLYVASEFIDMVSRLLYIKSRLLLPKKESDPDPREELVRILLDYSEIKGIAEELGKLFEVYKGRYEKGESAGILKRGDGDGSEPGNAENEEDVVINPQLLVRIIRRLERLNELGKLPPPIESVRLLTRARSVSVGGKVIGIMRRLYKSGGSDFVGLLDMDDAGEIVATFAAVLELLKANRIEIMGEDLLECRFILNK